MGVVSILGHDCCTNRFRIFLVASLNLNGRSTDLPNIVIGMTQWQSTSITGQSADFATFFTQTVQGGNGNKSVIMQLAVFAKCCIADCRLPFLATCKTYFRPRDLQPLCKSTAPSSNIL